MFILLFAILVNFRNGNSKSNQFLEHLFGEKSMPGKTRWHCLLSRRILSPTTVQISMEQTTKCDLRRREGSLPQPVPASVWQWKRYFSLSNWDKFYRHLLWKLKMNEYEKRKHFVWIFAPFLYSFFLYHWWIIINNKLNK